MADSAPPAALLIVDVQEDFCKPHGSLGLEGGRELASPINKLLDHPGFQLKLAARDYHPPAHISFASRHEGAVAFTSETTISNPENENEKTTTRLWPDHCVQGTPGCEIIPEINTGKLDAVIDKGTDKDLESYSAFGPPFRNPRAQTTKLDGLLRDAGITRLFCVGLSFNVCVFHTAIDAAKLGYATFVIRDATASRQSAEEKAATEREFEQRGISVIGLDSSELDFARRYCIPV